MNSKPVQDFLLAIDNGDYNKIKELIFSGVDVHCDNDAALKLACEKGDKEFVSYLLKAGAYAYSQKGRPLVLALENKDDDIVKLLINHAGIGLLNVSEYNSYLIIKNNNLALIDHFAQELNLEFYLEKAIDLSELTVIKHLIINHNQDIQLVINGTLDREIKNWATSYNESKNLKKHLDDTLGENKILNHSSKLKI